jgi:hypothetical protein
MPEVGDGRPAGCKPAALAHPQSDSGLWLACPASGKGLCPGLSEGPMPGSTPGGSTAVSRYGSARPTPLRNRRTRRDPSSGGRMRHTALTGTTRNRLGRHEGQRGYLASRGAPTPHTQARGRKPTPKRHTITAPAPDGRPMSATAAPQRAPATTGTPSGSASHPGQPPRPARQAAVWPS